MHCAYHLNSFVSHLINNMLFTHAPLLLIGSTIKLCLELLVIILFSDPGEFDDRSDNKGAEPEAVTVGVIVLVRSKYGQ